VDAIMTDDSDVFLFGGTNVIRGFFENDQSYVNYKASHIQVNY
jgi:hypothetical protein